MSLSRLSLGKRKERQATALYKKDLSQSEQGAFGLGAAKGGQHLPKTFGDEMGPFFAKFCLEIQAFYGLSQSLRGNREERALRTLPGLRIEGRNASVCINSVLLHH